MKKSFIYIMVLLLGVSTAFAQKIDRSKAPKAGKAPKIELGKYESFTLDNGLKVYVIENNKIPRVAYSLILDRDPILEGENAGYVGMAGQMMMAGTKNRTKEQLDKEIDFMGASLNASATSMGGSALKKHNEKLLELMADVLLNPTFPQEELDKMKKQTISGLKSAKDDPNSISSNVESVLNYGKNHPYGELSTEETVEKITVADCKQYYQTYFKPNIAYLAIVGDISAKEAKPLVEKYFGKWQKGDVKSKTYAMPKAPAKTKVALVEKTGAVQTVLTITHPVMLKLSDEDYLKANLMNQILGSAGSRLYRNLREDKGYTYGAYSSLSQDKVIGVFRASASVRTAVTDSAANEFLYELRRIRNEKVGEDELRRAKAVMAGSFARAMESPSTIASFALNVVRYNLPEDFYSTYLERLDQITAEDIQAVAKKYIQPENAYIVAVGDAKAIEESMKRFGEVTKYDMYGNVDTGVDPALLKGVTVDKVMEKYIEAVGGRKKLEAVKSLERTLTIETQGITIEFITSQKEGNKFLFVQKTPFGEAKQVYDGKKAVMISPQGKKEMEGKELESMQSSALMFPELTYKTNGNKYELGGVKNIEGSPAFEVIVTEKSGEKESQFFDVKSGLMVAMINEGSNVKYMDYQATDGILFPTKAVVTAQGQTLDGKMSTKVNPKLDDKLFATE